MAGGQTEQLPTHVLAVYLEGADARQRVALLLPNPALDS